MRTFDFPACLVFDTIRRRSEIRGGGDKIESVVVILVEGDSFLAASQPVGESICTKLKIRNLIRGQKRSCVPIYEERHIVPERQSLLIFEFGSGAVCLTVYEDRWVRNFASASRSTVHVCICSLTKNEGIVHDPTKVEGDGR